MPRRIESLFIDGPAGKLEALLEEPDDQAPKEAVLICHPHPKFGGTMHNKVVYRMARALRRAGAVALKAKIAANAARPTSVRAKHVVLR